MNWGYVIVVAIFFSVLLILTQRTIPSRRRIMRFFVFGLAILLMIRYQLKLENIIGYIIAAIIAFLFWLLIGRYNPVPEDSGIKVYGLDD